jgi:putative membrane protein
MAAVVSEVKEKVIVLCIDRDDDLGTKIGRRGPIIGRDANVEAATALLLADPEEVDGNTMLQAVKIYDELVAKGKDARVVTLTGDNHMGYDADKAVTEQFEKVLIEFPAESCVFVSDGADDEVILPIISSRLKITSVRKVVMKQAEQLEQTWVVLLNKLREPYYARLFLGVPALVILAFLASEVLGYGWRPIIAIVGLYLLIKGFGVEELLISTLKSIILPTGTATSIVYFFAFVILVIGAVISANVYIDRAAHDLAALEAAAAAIQWFSLFVIVIFITIFVGKFIILYPERRKFEIVNAAHSTANNILLTLVVYAAMGWIAGEFWFYQFLEMTLVCIIVAIAAIEIARMLRVSLLSRLKLENKEVITDVGTYVGKIVGVDRKKLQLFVQTPLGHKMPIRLDTIINVADRVIVRH